MTKDYFRLSDFARYLGMFGCYAFYEAGECIYVGKATCIYSRVKGHKRRFRKYETFSAWNLGDYASGMDYANAHAFLAMMEAYFISVLAPIENVNRPDFMAMFWSSSKTITAARAAERLVGIPSLLLPSVKPAI